VHRLRWQRLVNPSSRRCVTVALDHGLSGEPAEFRGLERFQEIVRTVAMAQPDALLVSAGQVKHLADFALRLPALIVRVDVTDAYRRPTPKQITSHLLRDAVTVALRADAVAVIVNLLSVPQHPEAVSQSIANILALRSCCERYALPLIVEVMVLRMHTDGTLRPGANATELSGLVRLAVELGADAIKVTPPDELEAFGELCAIAGVPLLVLGGARGEDAAVLEQTAKLITQGATGVIYGRNVIQHPNPPAMVRALKHLVHQQGTIEEAINLAAQC
jgi:class I fructose-bisphosphate aldolase